MNTTYSRIIKKTPYKTVFGMKPNGIPRFLGEINIEGGEHIFDDAFEKVVQSHKNEENITTFKQNFRYVDFSQQTQDGDDDGENTLRMSSLRCQKLRNEVAANLKKSREDKVAKYATKKLVKVAEFEEVDHVSVLIPKAVRHTTDLRRLPCVILKKSAGCSPIYKLICEYRIIVRSFTAASMMLFPGNV